jgi:hypothetical protein
MKKIRATAPFCAIAAASLLLAGCGGGGTTPSAAGKVSPADAASTAGSSAAASPSAAATGLRLVTSIAANRRHVDPLAFSPDGNTLAVGVAGNIGLWALH